MGPDGCSGTDRHASKKEGRPRVVARDSMSRFFVRRASYRTDAPVIYAQPGAQSSAERKVRRPHPFSRRLRGIPRRPVAFALRLSLLENKFSKRQARIPA